MDEQKIREAIERMRKIRNRYNAILDSIPESARGKSDYNNDVVVFDTAIEALEKQLPMIPTEEGNYFLVYKCPKCEKVLAIGVPYCPYCGQKLDWSEIV